MPQTLVKIIENMGTGLLEEGINELINHEDYKDYLVKDIKYSTGVQQRGDSSRKYFSALIIFERK